MSIETSDDVRVTKHAGFVAVSLSKVVEVSANGLCMICINGPDFEFEVLESIFSPIPIDEIMGDLIGDIVNDTDTGLDNLFTTVKDLQGEFSVSVRQEDFSVWKDSYYQDLVDLMAENMPARADDTEVTVEVVIMKNVTDLVFVLIANSDIATAMLDETDEEEEVLDELAEDDEGFDPED